MSKSLYQESRSIQTDNRIHAKQNTSINQEAKLVHSKIKKDKPMDKEEATIKRQSQHILAQKISRNLNNTLKNIKLEGKDHINNERKINLSMDQMNNINSNLKEELILAYQQIEWYKNELCKTKDILKNTLVKLLTLQMKLSLDSPMSVANEHYVEKTPPRESEIYSLKSPKIEALKSRYATTNEPNFNRSNHEAPSIESNINNKYSSSPLKQQKSIEISNYSTKEECNDTISIEDICYNSASIHMNQIKNKCKPQNIKNYYVNDYHTIQKLDWNLDTKSNSDCSESSIEFFSFNSPSSLSSNYNIMKSGSILSLPVTK